MNIWFKVGLLTGIVFAGMVLVLALLFSLLSGTWLGLSFVLPVAFALFTGSFLGTVGTYLYMHLGGTLAEALNLPRIKESELHAMRAQLAKTSDPHHVFSAKLFIFLFLNVIGLWLMASNYGIFKIPFYGGLIILGLFGPMFALELYDLIHRRGKFSDSAWFGHIDLPQGRGRNPKIGVWA